MRAFLIKFFLVTLCAVMAVGLISCDAVLEEGPTVVGYRVMKCSPCDCDEDPYPNLDYPFWYQEVEQGTAPQNASVVFEGGTYEGAYESSLIRSPNAYVSHRYSGEDGVSFEIHGETGVLTRIEFDKPAPSTTQKQDDCRKIADRLAEKYVKIKDYSVRTVKLAEGYRFIYYRELRGLESADKIEIGVYGDGSILSFDTVMVGKTEVTPIPGKDEQAMTEALEAGIREKYEELVKYEAQDDPLLVFLEDGSPAYLYENVLLRTETWSEAIPDEDGESYYYFSRKNHLCSFLLQPVFE